MVNSKSVGWVVLLLAERLRQRLPLSNQNETQHTQLASNYSDKIGEDL